MDLIEEKQIDEEEFEKFVSRHTHDVRNHLNGIEMEMMLLELQADPEGQESIERVRTEIGALENKLRWLSNRVVTPEVSDCVAADVFNLWNSRFGSSRDSVITWESSLSDESINVDMRMVADTLSEWLEASVNSSPTSVVAEAGDGVVRFLIGYDPSTDRQSIESVLPLGFTTLIERNGGSFCVKSPGEGGANTGVCSFPVV